MDIYWRGCTCIGLVGQVMLEEGPRLLGGAVCHLVVEQAFIGSFEEAVQWFLRGNGDWILFAGSC